MTLELPKLERRLFVDFLVRWLVTHGYQDAARALLSASPPPRDEVEALAFLPADVEVVFK